MHLERVVPCLPPTPWRAQAGPLPRRTPPAPPRHPRGSGGAEGISLPACPAVTCRGWVGGSETPPRLAEDDGARGVFAAPLQLRHHLLLPSPFLPLLPPHPPDQFKDKREPTGSPLPCYPPSQNLGVLHPSPSIPPPHHTAPGAWSLLQKGVPG